MSRRTGYVTDLDQSKLFEAEPSTRKHEVYRSSNAISVHVEVDEILKEACRPFDYAFDGESFYEPPYFNAPSRDGSWSIGVIVGPSGSGKTQLLRNNYGEPTEPKWSREKAIVSHFASAQEAVEKLSACGLNSVPSWCRPFHVLSNGEQFRARMAITLASNATFDEFTSVVDRMVAKSCCHAMQRHIRQRGICGVVFASCHYDILEWLQPDWVFDTLSASFTPRRSLRPRPEIRITVEPCDRSWWRIFKNHHYLTGDMNEGAETYLAKWSDAPVAFTSCLAMPHGTIRNAWREHRTVALPDYQGLGIGVRVSDWLGEFSLYRGRRYFSRTSHPRMGEYRNKSPLWRATSLNGKRSGQHSLRQKDNKIRRRDPNRVGYSHEYIGSPLLAGVCKADKYEGENAK